ncbi:hypothetical protein BVRB_025490, partial [Beta vulgaris subsp. vulgaris]
EWSTLGEDRVLKKIPLPSAWFRMLPGPVEGSYLPAGFVLKLAPTEPAPSPHKTPSKKQSTPKPERQTPGRKRRKSIEPGSASPPKASRQLPPRRAKRSLQSISSLLDSDEDSDAICHEYEQALFDKTSSAKASTKPHSPMEVDNVDHVEHEGSPRSASESSPSDPVRFCFGFIARLMTVCLTDAHRKSDISIPISETSIGVSVSRTGC